VPAHFPRRNATEEPPVTIKLRRVLLWILVIFAIYAIFNSPDQAADITRAAYDGIASGLASVGEFFDALLSD
jgi:hypothetical protein